MLDGARAGPGRRPEGPAGRADRPGLDLRPRQDAGGGAGAPGAPARARAPSHPPIPAEEFEQPELLAAEKEAIGLFISAHPLKPLREALRARVDCPLAGARRAPRQGLGDGRRDHHRGQADPHAQRRPHDVRDARRPRGRRSRCSCSARRWPSTRRRCAVDEVVLVQGPRRPQGSRQDLPGRAERRALRAHRRRRSSGREPSRRAAARRAAARDRRSRCTCACDVSALSARRRDRGPQARRSRTSPARPRCVLDIDDRAPARAGCALGEAYRVAAHADAAGRARARARRPSSRRGRPPQPAEASPRRAACGSAPRRAPALLAQAHRRARLPARAGPSRSSPGVSSTQGSSSKRGRREERARSPRSPSSPSPTLAWRSRLEPSGVCESLRCSEREALAGRSSREPRRAPRPCPRGVRMS